MNIVLESVNVSEPKCEECGQGGTSQNPIDDYLRVISLKEKVKPSFFWHGRVPCKKMMALHKQCKEEKYDSEKWIEFNRMKEYSQSEEEKLRLALTFFLK